MVVLSVRIRPSSLITKTYLKGERNTANKKYSCIAGCGAVINNNSIKKKRMRTFGNRKIKVNKQQLIEKIEANKKAHIKAFKEAVVAYKKEALKQLSEQTKKARSGNLELRLNLITPINNSENYDKIIDMFKWEVEELVELEQKEFNEYVQDETDFAIAASFSNNIYTAKNLQR